MATGAIAFTVGDVETASGDLDMTGSSNNPTLVPDANIVFGGSGTDRTVTVTPAANQSGTTTITLTVTDADGGATSDTFNLTVDPAPTVTSTAPADGADHVAVDANIVLTFSESMTASGSSFTLECPSGSAQSFTVSGSPGASITLDPTGTLPEGTTCTVTAVAANISDTDSVDPPDHLAADYLFSFTTDAAPAVTTTTPADTATAIDPSATITVNFNEPVDVSPSSFTISCNSTPQMFQVSGAGTDSITLDPDADLPSTAS